MVKVSLDKNVTIKLPSDFAIMSDDDIASKYPAYRRPIAMYISYDRKADFGYNVSNGAWGDDIKIMHDVYKATIKNSFTNVNFIKDTIVTVKKRKYVEFEYVSEFKDSSSAPNKMAIKNYTYSKYALQNGEIYIFTFNCPEKFKDAYQPVAREIMKTVKIGILPNKHDPKVIESTKKNPNKGKKPENPYLRK